MRKAAGGLKSGGELDDNTSGGNERWTLLRRSTEIRILVTEFPVQQIPALQGDRADACRQPYAKRRIEQHKAIGVFFNQLAIDRINTLTRSDRTDPGE